MVDVSSSKNSITITVGNTNKNNSVAITPGTANNSITTKSDTAQYWSNLSRDYSEQAKTSAYKAEQVKNEIITQKDSIIADVENTGVNAVDNITTIKSESIVDINNTVNDGIDNISTLKNDSLQEIETIADDIIADIQENGKSLPMFTPMWTDHIYNDASYLRADTFSWQNADIYITGYKILENEYNNENCVTEIDNGIEYRLSPNGFKIADASQNEAILDLYESGNEAWFYIIDTENRKFKLPREKSNEHKYLYFYVGNYSRPDTEINLGILAELANSQDLESVLASINEVKDNGIAELEATTASGVASITNKTNTGVSEITTASTTGKNSVTDATVSGLSSIEIKISTGTQSIETLTNTSVNNINNATTTGVKTINDTTSAGKAEIQSIVAQGIPTATPETAGIVRPDGETITITEDGVISSIGIKELPVASTDVLGCVKVDGETIAIANGVISAVGGGSGDEWEYSKGTNFYIKNKTTGFILQGIKYTFTGKNPEVVTFPKAFTTTNIVSSAAPVSVTTTTMSIDNAYQNKGLKAQYIVFGY